MPLFLNKIIKVIWIDSVIRTERLVVYREFNCSVFNIVTLIGNILSRIRVYGCGCRYIIRKSTNFAVNSGTDGVGGEIGEAVGELIGLVEF
jgi:hypothetical protein